MGRAWRSAGRSGGRWPGLENCGWPRRRGVDNARSSSYLLSRGEQPAQRRGGAMTKQQVLSLKSMEGTQVNVALLNGERIDDCQLVSSGRRRLGSLWLFSNGEDVFVPLSEVLDVWEAYRPQAQAA